MNRYGVMKEEVEQVRAELAEVEAKLEEIRQSSEYRHYSDMANQVRNFSNIADRQGEPHSSQLWLAAEALDDVCVVMLQQSKYWAQMSAARDRLALLEEALLDYEEEFRQYYADE